MNTAEIDNTTPNKKLPWTALAILSLIGIGLSILLTTHYYDIRSGMSGFHSFCNLGSKMNCDVVAASPYAELATGYPLSSFATGWYLALLAVALIGRNRFWRRDAGRFALLMTVFGFVLSGGYLAVMAIRLKTYCLFCLFMDGIAALAFITTVFWIRPEFSFSEHKPDGKQWRTLVVALASCLVISVFALKLLDNVSIPTSEIDQRVDAVLSSPVLPVDTEGAPSFGPKSAPITIAEFSDFQCPYCRIGAMVMNSLMDRYPSQVRVVFKPFPLDASCNRIITQPMHLTACEAARTALCAARQGKFQPVYETLFEHQTHILPGTPAKMAEDVGADAGKLDSCTKDPGVSSEISKSIEEGIQLGVQSTPTFFVNGHKVEGLLPAPFWNRLVGRLLANGPSAANAH